MYSVCHYNSPLGGITLACDEEGLTGLWFDGQKYFGGGILKGGAKKEQGAEEKEGKRSPVPEQTVKWLDIYFSGREPDFTPPLHLTGSEFRRCLGFHMDRRLHTKSLPAGLRNSGE